MRRNKSYYIDIFAGITKSAAKRLVRDKVKVHARWVLVILIMHRDIEYPEKWFKCSIRKIHELAGFSFTTIINSLRELEEIGIITVKRSGKRANKYKLNTGYLGICT